VPGKIQARAKGVFMKKNVITALLFVLLLVSLHAQNTADNVADFILSTYSTKSFINTPIQDADLEKILMCGIKAPSARNTQLWKFTVVRDIALERNVISNITEGNILIIVSGSEKSQPGVDISFDCALATQNMYLAAQGLGLGAHIYTGPVENINKNLKTTLKIPEGYKAIAVLRIGNKDSRVDATTAASKRKGYSEIVNESTK